MSRHEPLVTLRQIEDFARQAARLGAEGSRAQLDSDWKYQLAAERAVELMARRRIVCRPNCANATPGFRGARSSGCANRLIHGYDGVDYDIIWDVLQTHAPRLAERLPAIIAAES